jgi:hypothetical protein
MSYAAHSYFSPDDLRAMETACPTSAVKDIVAKGAIPGPSPVGGGGQVTPVRPGGGSADVPGSGTGWAREIPLGPAPGTRWIDQQLDAQDAKDRQQLIMQKAREQAALKAAKESK